MAETANRIGLKVQRVGDIVNLGLNLPDKEGRYSGTSFRVATFPKPEVSDEQLLYPQYIPSEGHTFNPTAVYLDSGHNVSLKTTEGTNELRVIGTRFQAGKEDLEVQTPTSTIFLPMNEAQVMNPFDQSDAHDLLVGWTRVPHSGEAFLLMDQATPVEDKKPWLKVSYTSPIERQFQYESPESEVDQAKTRILEILTNEAPISVNQSFSVRNELNSNLAQIPFGIIPLGPALKERLLSSGSDLSLVLNIDSPDSLDTYQLRTYMEENHPVARISNVVRGKALERTGTKVSEPELNELVLVIEEFEGEKVLMLGRVAPENHPLLEEDLARLSQESDFELVEGLKRRIRSNFKTPLITGENFGGHKMPDDISGTIRHFELRSPSFFGMLYEPNSNLTILQLEEAI